MSWLLKHIVGLGFWKTFLPSHLLVGLAIVSLPLWLSG